MNRFRHSPKLRTLSSSPLSETDQNSEKDDYTLAIVEDGGLFPMEPEDPLISPPHEGTTTGGAQPKCTIKPTMKLLENKFHSNKEKLEKMWIETAAMISKLRQTPHSVDKIRSAISYFRSSFGKYQLVLVSLMDFTSNAYTPECQKEVKLSKRWWKLAANSFKLWSKKE